MIVHNRETTLLRIYLCPICNKMFQEQIGNTTYSCAVNHSPGTCCHYAEREISSYEYKSIMYILNPKESK